MELLHGSPRLKSRLHYTESYYRSRVINEEGLLQVTINYQESSEKRGSCEPLNSWSFDLVDSYYFIQVFHMSKEPHNFKIRCSAKKW